jgi:hypothetical protein
MSTLSISIIASSALSSNHRNGVIFAVAFVIRSQDVLASAVTNFGRAIRKKKKHRTLNVEPEQFRVPVWIQHQAFVQNGSGGAEFVGQILVPQSGVASDEIPTDTVCDRFGN